MENSINNNDMKYLSNKIIHKTNYFSNDNKILKTKNIYDSISNLQFTLCFEFFRKYQRFFAFIVQSNQLSFK